MLAAVLPLHLRARIIRRADVYILRHLPFLFVYDWPGAGPSNVKICVSVKNNYLNT